MNLFGSSGIRAVYDEKLLETAYRVGFAVGKLYCNIVIGKDTRTSSDAMKQAVVSGVLAAESNCADAGLTPTPTLAYVTRRFDAGVMITASHNPPEYNGVKLFNPDGSSYDSLQQKMIESTLRKHAYDPVKIDPSISGEIYPDAVARHTEAVLAAFPQKLNLKVVVDAGGGAAGKVTPVLLEKMGCTVITLNCNTDGVFPRGIEPDEENLQELSRAVRESGAALGIAHDGDADRMMAVDEKGRYISGDRLLAIFAGALKAGEVVTTLDASMAMDEMGMKIRRTKIGDTWVSEELRHGGDFGGETSGAWIFPGISLCPDGVYAAACIAAIAAEHRLSRLADAVTVYPLMRSSVSSVGVSFAAMEAKLIALRPQSYSKTDGIKLNFKTGWLLVRPSGTEPKIRVTAEAKTEKNVQTLYNWGMSAIEKSKTGGESKR